jgi:predicted transcriptional regulator
MGKMKEIPRYNVISMRVSDEERKTLQELANELSVNISDMMRTALQHITHSQKSLELN